MIPFEKSPFPLTSIIEMVGDDIESVTEILNIFTEDTPLYLEKLEEHLAANDTAAAAKVIHTLKSTVSLAEKPELVSLCGRYQIEENLREVDRKEIDDKIISPIKLLLDRAFETLAWIESYQK